MLLLRSIRFGFLFRTQLARKGEYSRLRTTCIFFPFIVGLYSIWHLPSACPS